MSSAKKIATTNPFYKTLAISYQILIQCHPTSLQRFGEQLQVRNTSAIRFAISLSSPCLLDFFPSCIEKAPALYINLLVCLRIAKVNGGILACIADGPLDCWVLFETSCMQNTDRCVDISTKAMKSLSLGNKTSCSENICKRSSVMTKPSSW